MTDTTATATANSRTGRHTAATQTPDRHSSPIRKESRMKSLRASKPVLWFLFLFNAAVAVAVGAGGSHLHVHGHSLHGSQPAMTAVGMGVVALGAGVGLFRSRRQQA